MSTDTEPAVGRRKKRPRDEGTGEEQRAPALFKELANRNEWLMERRTGIGSSDAPCIAGESTKSAVTLWAQKLGHAPEDDLSDVEAVLWGMRLEPPIREEVSCRLRAPVHYPGAYALYRHPLQPFMLASVDGLFEEPNDGIAELFGEWDMPIPVGQGLLEIKTASHWKAREWPHGDFYGNPSWGEDSSEPDWPLQYKVQTQHALEVLGFTWGVVACLIGGQRLEMRPFVKHVTLTKALIEAEHRFWGYVEREEHPPIDGSESTSKTLQHLYWNDSEKEVEVVNTSEELLETARRLESVKEKMKTLKGVKDECENQLKAAIGEATHIRLANDQRYSWKVQKGYHRKACYVEPTRKFRKCK